MTNDELIARALAPAAACESASETGATAAPEVTLSLASLQIRLPADLPSPGQAPARHDSARWPSTGGMSASVATLPA